MAKEKIVAAAVKSTLTHRSELLNASHSQKVLPKLSDKQKYTMYSHGIRERQDRIVSRFKMLSSLKNDNLPKESRNINDGKTNKVYL